MGKGENVATGAAGEDHVEMINKCSSDLYPAAGGVGAYPALALWWSGVAGDRRLAAGCWLIASAGNRPVGGCCDSVTGFTFQLSESRM